MPNTPIDEKRAKIKYWLEVSGLSRQELADKLDVHISSLNGWLSNKSMPDKRWEDIVAIFEKEKQPQTVPEVLRAVALAFTEKEHDDMTAIAAKEGLSLDVFLRKIALEVRKKRLNLD